MAKDPAFLFYPNDYIGGTMGMTFEEKGAYIELLMLQFNRGHMTKHMIGQTIGQLWDNIQDKFTVDADGRYYNERLEQEQNKRKKYSESRRNNKKGINQYTKKKSGHMTSHMENVNENRNIDSNNKGIPTLENFVEYAKSKKPNIDSESLKMKYESWVENDWMTGGDKPRKIKNWKTTLLNTLPHLKENEVSKPDYSNQDIYK